MATRREFAKSMVGAAAAVSSIGGGVFARKAAIAATPKREEITALSLTEASARIHSGAITPTQFTQACLERIRIYNPKLDAFITVLADRALQQAALMDLEQKAGKFRGALHGIPIALKDNIDTAGIRTTAASRVYDDRVPHEDAEVVRRLLAAGAILIGKTNMDEFAAGESYFGAVRNPWKLDRDPSGSSSGSAAAVAAALAFGALGTDTGGSVRGPAAYCGIVGLKPTYGLVPTRGLVPQLLSWDHCGPMTRTVDDAALLLNVLAGYDQLDITSVEHPKEDYLAALDQPVSGLRLGIPRAPFFDYLDGDTSTCVETAIRTLTGMTKGARDVSLPSTAGYRTAFLGEVWAYHQELFANSENNYMLPFRRTLKSIRDDLNATDGACSSKITNYIRRRWDLTLLRRTVDLAFTDFDLVVLPTLRVVPKKLKDAIHDQESLDPHNANDPYEINFENCEAFNILGLPALSVPCGFGRDGLPVGLTIAGPRFSEGRIMALARAYELRARWDEQRPPLTPDTTVPPLIDHGEVPRGQGG